MNETLQKIINLLSSISNTKIIEKIDNSTSLTNDIGFDSIKIIALIVQIEESFNIILDDDDLEFDNLDIVGNLVNLIESKVKND